MKTLTGLLALILITAFHMAPASHEGNLSFNSAGVDLPKILAPTFRKDTLLISKFGAVADGLTLNTSAINKAIEQCNRRGGGVVVIPRGLWLTGPISLKSNVNLHLAEGALVQFTDQRTAYPLVNTSWEGEDAVRNQAPISGTDLDNIAITGKGILDGAGDAWRMVKKIKLTDDQWKKLVASGGVVNDKKDLWYPSEQSFKGATMTAVKSGQPMAYYEGIKDFLRPNMLSLTRCKRILLEGVTFQNSPAWCLHPLLCEHITLRNVTVKNPWYAQNGDGLDLESCRNGLVEACTFDVGDDGICIKSGRDEQGRKRGVPTENIIVRNCRVYHAHGGFVIGSEMSGGVKNLYVSNCQFMGTDVGLRFKTARGRGGIVENIYVDGIDMTNIAGEAILFDMYYAAKDPVPQQGESTPGENNELPIIPAQPLSEATPQFRSFQIRNVTCKGAETGIMVRGLPEMAVKAILIENVVLQSRKGFVCIEAENIRLKNVTLLSPAKTLMQIQNSRNITLDNIHYADNTNLLMHISGDRSNGIKLLNTNTSHAKKTAETSAGVPANALRMN